QSLHIAHAKVTGSTHNRCEVTSKVKMDTWPASGSTTGYFDWNQEYWMGFSIYLENAVTSMNQSISQIGYAWNSIMQNHSVPNGWNWGVCDAGHNNWSVSYDDGATNGVGYLNMNIRSRPVANPSEIPSGGFTPILWNIPLGNVDNQWIDFVLNWVTSDGADGKFRAWFNTQLVIEHYGSNHHTNDTCGLPRERVQLLQLGSYKPNSSENWTHQYYDNVRIANETGSFAAVDPSQ
ncbi:MAG: heparin lyase I family protein, partial [Candidatus Thorarchaeota archaeon]